jgi:chloramphenicol 3-O-phosphotransferase
MAEAQAAVVHEGVIYDVTIDTSHASPESGAATILSSM